MARTGAFDFKLAEGARDGAVEDENKIGPGCWAWIDRTGTERWLFIYARCPDCACLGTLWYRRGDKGGRGHDIDAAGNVSPSVQETCQHVECGFHTQPTRLLGFVDRR